MLSPIRHVWTCSRASSSTSRPAPRSRWRVGRSRACRLPAGGRRDGCTRSAWRIFGWTSWRPRRCSRVRVSSSTRARSPSSPSGRRLARWLVPRGAVDVRRVGKLDGGRGLRGRRPLRVRVFPPRAHDPATRDRGALPQVHVCARSDVREPLRRRARGHRLGTAARNTRALEPLRYAPRPARRVVPLPPPIRRTAPERARTNRAGCRRSTQRSGNGLVHRE